MTTQNLRSQNSDLRTNLKSTDVKVRAYNFSIDIIHFTNELPNKRVFWVIGDQLVRSATSIGANMIGAKGSSSRREFIRFYEIALKSAHETIYWLSLLRDTAPELSTHSQKLLAEAEEITKMLSSSVLTLKGKNKI